MTQTPGPPGADSTDASPWSYRPGSWFAIVGSASTLLLPASEKRRAADLWARIDDGEDFDTVLDALLQTGLGALPAFALIGTDVQAGTTRLLLRGGAVRASATTDQGPVEVEGPAGRTWVEQTLEAVTALEVEVEPDAGTAQPDLTVLTGLVRVSRVSHPARAAAPVDLAARPAAVATDELPPPPPPPPPLSPVVDEPDAPVLDPAPDLPAADLTAAELDDDTLDPAPGTPVEPSVDPIGERADVPPPPPSFPPPSTAGGWPAPPPPVEPSEPEPDGAGADGSAPSPATEQLDMDGVLNSDALVVPTEEHAEADPEPTTDAVTDLGEGGRDPDRLADPDPDPADGEPVAAPAPSWAAGVDLPPSPAAPPSDDEPLLVPPATPDTPSAPPPYGDHDGLTRAGSDDDQPNRPVFGIAGQPPAPDDPDRPVARLHLSHGETVDVDRVVLVGRAPEARRFTTTDQPLLVTVPSPMHEISSTHVEIRPGTGVDHGSAVVTDMGSTNGTVLVQPGLGPEDLVPGIAVQLIPGATINLGDGVTISVAAP